MSIFKDKNLKWWLGVGSFTFLFLFISIFSYFKTSFLLNGVKIKAEITRIPDSPVVVLNGNAYKATKLSINGREIYIEKNGNFSDKIALIDGYSVLTISAVDKFGKTDEKKIEMVYKEPAPQIATIEDKSNY